MQRKYSKNIRVKNRYCWQIPFWSDVIESNLKKVGMQLQGLFKESNSFEMKNDFVKGPKILGRFSHFSSSNRNSILWHIRVNNTVPVLFIFKTRLQNLKTRRGRHVTCCGHAIGNRIIHRLATRVENENLYFRIFAKIACEKYGKFTKCLAKILAKFSRKSTEVDFPSASQKKCKTCQQNANICFCESCRENMGKTGSNACGSLNFLFLQKKNIFAKTERIW